MSDWETTRRRHGTQSGWKLHQELGERPCDPCYLAKSSYDKNRRAAPDEAIKNRARAGCQQRALLALQRCHLDEYRVLYLAEKAKLKSVAS